MFNAAKAFKGSVGFLPRFAVGRPLESGVGAHSLVDLPHRGPSVGQPLGSDGKTPVEGTPGALADSRSVGADGLAFI